MASERRSNARYAFSGHQSFPFRYPWLPKGVQHLSERPDLFARDDAFVILGVGKNMVRSIRHWCTATGVFDRVDHRGAVRISELGRALLDRGGWDPYLEDPGTLWLPDRRCRSSPTHLSGGNGMDEQAGRANRTDAWDSGDAYEPYVGRWSRPVARQFLGWLAAPPGGRWLDVGCGTGALAGAVLALAAPREVVGIDPSPAYVAFARERVDDPRAAFEVGDARALRADDASFDAVVSGLVLNFVPEPEIALSEMARVARPGGVVGAYVWDYAEGMRMMRHFWDAAVELDPSAGELDEGRRFPLCRPEPLADLFRAAGLEEVEVRAIEVPTVFRDFGDYWSPFLGGQAPAPGYAMSLSEDRRAALRERIRAGLPTNARGEHPLTARAWAVRGVR